MEALGHKKIYIHFQSQSEINFRMAEGCHLKKPVLKLKMNMAESCHSNNAMRALDSSLVPLSNFVLSCFLNHRTMAEWRHFANKQKEKRGKGQNASKKDKSDVGSELTVQRMTSDVSGKQQKYSRIGPREYVAFDCEDLSIENIRSACQRHFANAIEKGMVCDVLAGERGPSCSKMSQIPDLKVFYVRFVKKDPAEDEEEVVVVSRMFLCLLRYRCV